jgi:2-polyprenyl-3-methyl-5-hydroxy-6-metoxy-1,4-benzoquinol methylase
MTADPGPTTASDVRPIATEPVPRCPACGGPPSGSIDGLTDRLYAVPGTWSFSCCGRCRSLWLHPRPVEAELHRCYPPQYFTHATEQPAPAASSGDGRFAGLHRGILADARGYQHLAPRRKIERLGGRALARLHVLDRRATYGYGPLLPKARGNRRLLDVGAGSGTFLALMRTLGWETAGFEPDPSACRVAQEDFGLDVRAGALNDAFPPEARFDVVTAFHVIEHVHDPRQLLRSMVDRLVPGGELLIATPNASSVGRRLFGAFWFPLQPPQHLAIYSSQALVEMLQEIADLGDVKVRTSSRLARKVAIEYRSVKHSGVYHRRIAGRARAWRAMAAGYALVQGLATVARPVGEELIATAIKR